MRVWPAYNFRLTVIDNTRKPHLEMGLGQAPINKD